MAEDIIIEFKVTEILGSNLINTDGWKLGERVGTKVQIRGLKSFEGLDDQKASTHKELLKILLKDQKVELKNGELLDNDVSVIRCDVFLRGVNVKNYLF